MEDMLHFEIKIFKILSCLVFFVVVAQLASYSLYCANIGSTQACSNVHSLPLIVVAVALRSMTCLNTRSIHLSWKLFE